MVYSLKHSTGLQKWVHMNHVMQEKDRMAEQAFMVSEAPKCVVCGGDVEAVPMKKGVCYDCYRAALDAIAAEQESQQKEIDEIKNWLGDDGETELGCRAIVSGGEVAELDPAFETDEEMPF